MSKQQNDVQSLAAMLRYRRPAGSRTELQFIKRHILPLGMNIDKYGNLYKKIGDSPVLWSSHTDTVHGMGGKQKIHYNAMKGKFSVFDPESNCLGADDTAGVWIMTQMIEAGIPGLYVFHRAEEVGGKGSDFFVKNNKEQLKGIEFAVAFDRAGTSSIITHQMCQRCCSEDFSQSLGTELGMGHKSDSGGSFTDTANYIDDVAECTNLSVGYRGQHSKTEDLDAKYLFELRDALFDFNYKNLTAKRKAGEVEWKYSNYRNWEDYYYDQYDMPSQKSFEGMFERDYEKCEDGIYRKKKPVDDKVAGYMNRNGILIPIDETGKEILSVPAIPLKKSGNTIVDLGSDEESAGSVPAPSSSHKTIHGGFERLVQLIKDNPREVADFFEESGVTADELGYAVYQRGGFLRTSTIPKGTTTKKDEQ